MTTVRSDSVLNAEADTTTLLAPAGFCPRCDYPMETGICSECGLESDEVQLRRRPRNWLQRRWRVLVVWGVVFAGLTWFVKSYVDLIPYLPTSMLLDFQGSRGKSSQAAADELGTRYIANELSKDQTLRFMQQWVDVNWKVESGRGSRIFGNASPLCQVGNEFVLNAFPANTKLPAFTMQETVVSVRVEGVDIPLTSQGSRQFNVGNSGCAVAMNGYSPCAPRGAWTTRASFMSSSVVLLLRSSERPASVEVDTVVVVEDAQTFREIARWPMTHVIEKLSTVKAFTAPWMPPKRRRGPVPRRATPHQPANPPTGLDPLDWPQGMEDLVFPYGEIPGEFDLEQNVRSMP
jgi:hypothetical protein